MKKMRNRMLLFLTEKEKREKRRIKQSEIAKALGVSSHTITNWIKDEITQIDTNVLISLCDYFGVTFDQMLYIEETDEVANTIEN
jgi:transcriptional regulator with XRE-family HTH domain